MAFVRSIVLSTCVILLSLACCIGNVHGVATRTPDDRLVPAKHDGPAYTPDAINKITDDAIAGASIPGTDEDKSLNTMSGTDHCFYSHLDSCGSCVLDTGCGYCADGPLHVKGRCMSGNEKGPTKYTGCKTWHYTVCTMHKKGPEYVAPPPPQPKPIVPKPLITEQKEPVKILKINGTKLTPWKVEPEKEPEKAPTTPAEKKNAVKQGVPKTKSTPKVKKAVHHVDIGFKMEDYVKTIANQEAELHKELEHENNVVLESHAPEEHDDNPDEGTEDLTREIYGAEKRSVRQRRKKLEEDWKRQWMLKQKMSNEYQNSNDIKNERHALKSVWDDAPSQVPPEALVQPGKAWAQVKNKNMVLSKLHDERGFISNKKYLDVHGPHWQDSSNVDQIHLGLGTTGGESKPTARKSLRKRL